jgi:hypothetical protein
MKIYMTLGTIIFAISILCNKSFCQNDSMKCYPPCRTGYTCYKGQCISLCNPPCPTGLTCTSDMTCIPTSSVIVMNDKVLEANPYSTHYGKINTGAVLTILGIIATGVGIFVGVSEPYGTQLAWGAGTAIGGVTLFSVGLPTLIVGMHKQSKHDEWEKEHHK